MGCFFNTRTAFVTELFFNAIMHTFHFNQYKKILEWNSHKTIIQYVHEGIKMKPLCHFHLN